MLRLALLLLLLSPAWAQTLTEPALPCWFLDQERIPVEIQTTPGRSLALRVPNESDVPLTEGPPGTYRAVIHPDGTAALLLIENGQVIASPGTLECLEFTRPVAEVIHDNSTFRSGPTSDDDRYDPVVKGLKLEVTGRKGNWLRTAAGWIANSDVQLSTGPPSHPVLTNVRSTETRDGTIEVKLRLTEPCPWQTREEVGGGLTLILPNTPMAMHEMAYPPNPNRLKSLVLRPGQSTQLELQVGRLWGYQTRWEAPDLVLTLQAPPKNTLEGLRIILDAGHGGSDPGAIGLHGMKEKDVNLAVTDAFRQELEEAGALVTMTRTGDTEVAGGSAEGELAARVTKGEQAHGQLFISIHHNAKASIKEGRQSHGTHIYYYRLQSNELARSLARPLAEAIGEPSFMHLWRSFHLTRQAGMPAVLVEVNFVSNPVLEKDMLGSPEYARKAARGLRQGLEEFIRASGSAEQRSAPI